MSREIEARISVEALWEPIDYDGEVKKEKGSSAEEGEEEDEQEDMEEFY